MKSAIVTEVKPFETQLVDSRTALQLAVDAAQALGIQFRGSGVFVFEPSFNLARCFKFQVRLVRRSARLERC